MFLPETVFTARRRAPIFASITASGWVLRPILSRSTIPETMLSAFMKNPVFRSDEGDLCSKTNSLYCFKDGSAEKYNGSDDRMIDLLEPSDQSGREGMQRVPLR